jgi:hypothetical protein
MSQWLKEPGTFIPKVHWQTTVAIVVISGHHSDRRTCIPEICTGCSKMKSKWQMSLPTLIAGIDEFPLTGRCRQTQTDAG